MIENQSDNIDNKENDISDQDNTPEDAASPEDLTIENEESFSLDTSGGTGASGFVAYDSLTQEKVLAWTPVAERLASSNTKINHESWIESVKNPPAPAEVEKALPW